MALKFRRGTTAQQSGSLAFGEPFVNTTLQTLLVGGNNGDITLATIGTGSTGIFGDISGSGLDITGNAEIHGNLVLGGNITIGDANTDTIALNADLSSSIIPDATNTFDLGSTTKVYRNVYATSISGAIAATNGVVSGSSQVIGILDSLNSFSGSQLTQNSTLATYTGSVNTRLTEIGVVSGSLISSASNAKTTNDSQDVSITNLNTYTGSLKDAIQLTGSTVSFLGNIVVYGTQSVINSQNVQISDNILYLSPTASIDNDLGIVGHYNDGTYRHAGIFMDASDGHSWKVFNGLTTETSAQIDTAGTGFTLADFKAGAFSGTSFNGTINATNGVISGSSQIPNSSITNAQLANNYIQIAGYNIGLGTAIGAATIGNAIGAFSGSSQVDLTTTTNYASGILTRLNAVGVVSGSSQISHDSTTGYSANRHVDHTSVTLTAGGGLTGGGDISTNRTFAVGAGSYITVNADDVAVNTSTLIPAISGTILSSITGDVTISAGGVATISANSVALGTDTTGDYVASLVAGTGVTLSNNSGESATPTIAIGQAVATTSTPTFGNLTINGTITATGDITAYYTSDRRHKNNIQTIKSALLKVTKLNGVTWEWNDDVSEVTKSTPKTGLIAQEVQAVLPQVVTEREDGFLALDYSKMMGLMVEAIKEQQIQIDNLTAKVEELKRQRGL